MYACQPSEMEFLSGLIVDELVCRTLMSISPLVGTWLLWRLGYSNLGNDKNWRCVEKCRLLV